MIFVYYVVVDNKKALITQKVRRLRTFWINQVKLAHTL